MTLATTSRCPTRSSPCVLPPGTATSRTATSVPTSWSSPPRQCPLTRWSAPEPRGHAAGLTLLSTTSRPARGEVTCASCSPAPPASSHLYPFVRYAIWPPRAGRRRGADRHRAGGPDQRHRPRLRRGADRRAGSAGPRRSSGALNLYRVFNGAAQP